MAVTMAELTGFNDRLVAAVHGGVGSRLAGGGDIVTTGQEALLAPCAAHVGDSDLRVHAAKHASRDVSAVCKSEGAARDHGVTSVEACVADEGPGVLAIDHDSSHGGIQPEVEFD